MDTPYYFTIQNKRRYVTDEKWRAQRKEDENWGLTPVVWDSKQRVIL
jgi:hypothetical protein